MNAPDLNKRTLNRLPHPVQERMREVGLRATLEDLFEHLHNRDTPPDECADIVELLDWTISVLMAASGPLVHQTFANLNKHFSGIRDYISRHDFHSYAGHIPPILQELSAIPTTRADYSLEAAKRAASAVQTARRSIVASEASMRTKREEAERLLKEYTDGYRETLADEAKAVSTRFNRLRAVATGRLHRLKESATDEHESVSQEMANLLEDLQERYGFTAGQALGGAHESAAEAENELAESHGKRSRLSMWGAVIWAGLAQITWMTPWAPDWEQWFDALRSLPIVGSPIIILLFVAKREGRVAAEHRRRHERLRSLALQFKSWEPYRSTLKDFPDDDKLQLEQQIAERLFVGDTPAVQEPDP